MAANNTVRVEVNAAAVTAEIRRALVAFLEEAGGEVESQAVAFSPVAEGQLKGNWGHSVDESKLEVTIGNTSEHAIWMEFGTGEHALEGNGRKGGWWIPVGNGAGQISEEAANKYNFRIRTNAEGQKFAFTKGARPRRMLFNAMQDMEGAIQTRANDIIRGRLGGD